MNNNNQRHNQYQHQQSQPYNQPQQSQEYSEFASLAEYFTDDQELIKTCKGVGKVLDTVCNKRKKIRYHYIESDKELTKEEKTEKKNAVENEYDNTFLVIAGFAIIGGAIIWCSKQSKRLKN